jgi:hypothetical protein
LCWRTGNAPVGARGGSGQRRARNPYARVCFRLGDEDAKKLADGFAFFEAKDLQNLAPAKRSSGWRGLSTISNLTTRPLAPVDEETAAEAVRGSSSFPPALRTRRDLIETEPAREAPTQASSKPADPSPSQQP